jgi:hypothetical protein
MPLDRKRPGTIGSVTCFSGFSGLALCPSPVERTVALEEDGLATAGVATQVFSFYSQKLQ